MLNNELKWTGIYEKLYFTRLIRNLMQYLQPPRMKFRILLAYLLFLGLSTLLRGQEESRWYDRPPSTEIHLNVTNTLASIFNRNQSFADPYQLSIKYGNKHAFKFSGAVNIVNRSSDANTNFLNVKESNYRTRVGYEKRAVMARKYALYYGIDLAINSLNSQSEAGFVSNQAFVLEDKTFQFGFGPSIGIMYHINKHISISTEAFAYFFITNRKLTEPSPTGGPGSTETQKGTSFQPVPPSSLYLCFKF
jgi:hypothetical protein